MVITKDVYLPSYEELDVEEVELGGHVLRAGAFHFGKYCEQQNDEFMLCKYELGQAPCIGYGKQVTACALEFFRKLKKHCYDELDRYSYCIDQSNVSYKYEDCRRTQHAFDECVLKHLKIERPPYYYYTRPRVFDSTRPAPPKPEDLIFENVPDAPIPEEGLPEPTKANFGSRFWWKSR